MTRYSSPSGRYHQWDLIVEDLRATPNTWAVRLTDVPARLARTVWDRSAPELHLSDGVIEAKLVNSYELNGKRRGDLYLKYSPHVPESG